MATASQAKVAGDTEQALMVSTPSRREFLYYIWMASLVLLLGEAGAGILWFAYPRFKEGTFGGTFAVGPGEVPGAGEAPNSKPAGRFHISHLGDDSLIVLYGVCTHLGCLPSWVEANTRFECPCHGSKFELDGKYIEGPAPSSLDRFITTIYFEDGTVETTNAEGDPIPLAGRTISRIDIDTGNRVRRTGAKAKL